jgi:hypothetical protein
MSNAKDTITKGQTEPAESLKDDAQSKISSTDKDSLRDIALDDVAGGTGPAPIGQIAPGG